MSRNSLAAVLATLEVLALERVSEDHHYKLISALPPWLQAFSKSPILKSKSFRLKGWFDYLDYFLEEAENYWRSEAPRSLRSLPWAEEDDNSAELYLEAQATRTEEDKKLLLIQAQPISLEQRRSLLQTAREAALVYQRFQREQEKREVLLHSIVHDLKGPLAGVVNAFGLLAAKPEMRGEPENILKLGERQAFKLEALIQDILESFSAEVTALQEFRYESWMAPDLLAVAKQAYQLFEPLFAKRHVRLELDSRLQEIHHRRAVADKDGLERVFNNLLENALRHCPIFSTVELRLRQIHNRLRVEIQDEGPGVPVEIENELFQKFSRGGKHKGSAGLGLFICRLNVERWKGRIGHHRPTEGGACFWFELELETRPPSESLASIGPR